MASWDVTTAAARLEFDTTQATHIRTIPVDTNHVLTLWQDSAGDGRAQVFTVNTSTWVVSTTASSFEFDTANYSFGSVVEFAPGRFVIWYQGVSADGFVQTFAVNTSDIGQTANTWTISTSSSRLEFDTQNGIDNYAIRLPDVEIGGVWRFLNVFRGGAATADWRAQVFQVSSTFAVTTAAASFVFNTDPGSTGGVSLAYIGSNKALVLFTDASSDGNAQVLQVNTSTWAVTTAAALLEFDTQQFDVRTPLIKVDANRWTAFYRGTSGQDGFAQTFTVNTSTWAVTTTGAALEFDTDNNSHNAAVLIDATHIINFWAGNPATVDALAQVFTVNTSTWVITTSSGRLQFDTDLVGNLFVDAVQLAPSKFLAAWSTTDLDGMAQVFSVELPYLAIYVTDSIKIRDEILGSYSTHPLDELYELQGANTYGNNGALIDSSHYVSFGNWVTGANQGSVGVYGIDNNSWEITQLTASRLGFQATTYNEGRTFAIDSNHVLNLWNGGGTETPHGQVFTINTTTWAVTTAAASGTIHGGGDATGFYIAGTRIDTNHWAYFLSGTDADGFGNVIRVNTSTWAVSTGTELEFDTQNGTFNAAATIDSSHVINIWLTANVDMAAQVFTVNTSTLALTTSAAPFIFDNTAPTSAGYAGIHRIDETHYLAAWRSATGLSSEGAVQVLAVNTSTWEVTTAGAKLQWTTVDGNRPSIAAIDSAHYIISWQGSNLGTPTQVITVNTSTWECTTTWPARNANPLEYTGGSDNSIIERIDATHFINQWAVNGATTNYRAYLSVIEVNIPSLSISVVDTISVTENVARERLSSISVFDALTLTENRGVSQVFTIAAPDQFFVNAFKLIG